MYSAKTISKVHIMRSMHECNKLIHISLMQSIFMHHTMQESTYVKCNTCFPGGVIYQSMAQFEKDIKVLGSTDMLGSNALGSYADLAAIYTNLWLF